MITWNTVTWYSKLLAVLFFIGVLPAWTFYIGMQYQATKDVVESLNKRETINIPASEQKNEVVFLHRDNEVLSLYVINTDGSNKRLVYRNSDKVNSNIISPRWSTGDTILFGAMKDGVWKIFSIKSDGTDLKLTKDADMFSDFALSRESRDENLIVEELDNERKYTLSVAMGGEKNRIYSVDYSMCGHVCPVGGLLHEASFSPNKKHVIFEQGKDIMIVGADGKDARVLTEGSSPDWR